MVTKRICTRNLYGYQKHNKQYVREAAESRPGTARDEQPRYTHPTNLEGLQLDRISQNFTSVGGAV